MKRKSVESVLINLSPEELECFRDLIEECLARERDYIEMKVKLKNDITLMGTAEKDFLYSIQILNSKAQELQDILNEYTSAAFPDNDDTIYTWKEKLH